MQCKVDDCGNSVRYKAACLCQKHYFRLRRYGTTDTIKVGKGRDRYVTPSGYVRIRRPGHPLANKDGLVSEHRAVVYDDLGPGPMCCELCGVTVTWETVHIDHIDNTTDNNVRSNLRPTCNACNTKRGRLPEHSYAGRLAIEWNGRTMTAHEWVRELSLPISSSCLRRRIRSGQTAEQALFGEKKTHSKPKLSPNSGAQLGAVSL